MTFPEFSEFGVVETAVVVWSYARRSSVLFVLENSSPG